MIYVKFHGLDATGKNINKGRIVWDGKTMRAVPDTPLLQTILQEPIVADGGNRKLTKDDGQAFLEGLEKHYKSAYLFANEPVQDIDKEEKT
jgi:hypothetical protein